MGGQAAYVYYISPGQLNVLAPDVPAGPVTVTVTTPSGTSASFTTTASLYGPAFFLWPGSQAVATRTDYSYAVKAGTFAGANTAAAKPGEVIILWATGFGPTIPTPPPGVAVPSGNYPTASTPTVTIDNISAMEIVYGAALRPVRPGCTRSRSRSPLRSPMAVSHTGEHRRHAAPTGVVLSIAH